MIIVFDSNDFLYDLFPEAKEHGQNHDALIAAIEADYTVEGFKPVVTTDADSITIDLLTQLQLPYGLEYEVATQLIQSKP
jgi:hypothetical protein